MNRLAFYQFLYQENTKETSRLEQRYRTFTIYILSILACNLALYFTTHIAALLIPVFLTCVILSGFVMFIAWTLAKVNPYMYFRGGDVYSDHEKECDEYDAKYGDSLKNTFEENVKQNFISYTANNTAVNTLKFKRLAKIQTFIGFLALAEFVFTVFSLLSFKF